MSRCVDTYVEAHDPPLSTHQLLRICRIWLEIRFIRCQLMSL